MNLSKTILKWLGWHLEFTVPDFDKCIYCVAPHTSNWDFMYGELAIHAVGRKAGFLMKSSWFFFPLGALFKKMGGIPVHRGQKSGSLVEEIVKKYNEEPRLALAIAPEGTRKYVSRWHTGFLRIALGANIPIVLGALDYEKKRIIVSEVFEPTGDMDADLESVKEYYSQFRGKHDKI